MDDIRRYEEERRNRDRRNDSVNGRDGGTVIHGSSELIVGRNGLGPGVQRDNGLIFRDDSDEDE